MTRRILDLPLVPLLLTLSTSNTLLAIILFSAMTSSPDAELVIGHGR